jgi:hypothetical protein
VLAEAKTQVAEQRLAQATMKIAELQAALSSRSSAHDADKSRLRALEMQVAGHGSLLSEAETRGRLEAVKELKGISEFGDRLSALDAVSSRLDALESTDRYSAIEARMVALENKPPIVVPTADPVKPDERIDPILARIAQLEAARQAQGEPMHTDMHHEMHAAPTVPPAPSSYDIEFDYGADDRVNVVKIGADTLEVMRDGANKIRRLRVRA